MITRKSIVPQVIALHPGSDDRLPQCVNLLNGDLLVLLGLEVIERANRVLQLDWLPGDAGESITVQGLDFASLHEGDELAIGDEVRLTIMSLGQHREIVLYDPLVPPLLQQHGIFARVDTPGVLCIDHIIH